MQSIILSIINAFILSQPDLAVKPLVIQLSNYFWPSKNRRQFIKSWCKITVKPLKLKLIVCSLISIVWLQIHKNYKYVSLSNKLLTSLYKPEKKKHVLRLSPLCLAEHIKPLFSSNTFFLAEAPSHPWEKTNHQSTRGPKRKVTHTHIHTQKRFGPSSTTNLRVFELRRHV